MTSDSDGNYASSPWLVLDGAHTPDSAQAVAKTVRQLFPDNPVALVVAMADDKDHRGVLRTLRQVLQPNIAIFTTAPIAGSSQRCVQKNDINHVGVCYLMQVVVNCLKSSSMCFIFHHFPVSDAYEE